MLVVPFWFSMEHCWNMIMPFWLSADDIINDTYMYMYQFWKFLPMKVEIYLSLEMHLVNIV